MSEDTFIICCIFIVGGYIVLGILLSGIICNFTDMDLEDCIFATMLFWPIVLLIGAIFQLIHFVKAMFKGEY